MSGIKGVRLVCLAFIFEIVILSSYYGWDWGNHRHAGASMSSDPCGSALGGCRGCLSRLIFTTNLDDILGMLDEG